MTQTTLDLTAYEPQALTTCATSPDYGTRAFWARCAAELMDRTLVCDALGFRHLIRVSPDCDNRVRAYLAELVSRETAYQAGTGTYYSSRADAIALLASEGITA